MGSGEAKKFRAMFGSAGRHGESFWTEESNNVGLKLLKGMGWETGQGLGKHGEGSTHHIKQTRKTDNRGIGASAATRDEAFKASQDLFNGVLARLNGNADDAGADGATELGGHATTIKGSIAKRQLVTRFRRAKDTSTASADDLAAIFGRRQEPSASADAGTSAAAGGEASDGVPPEQHTSSVSLHDYFARKRRELGLAPSEGAAAAAGSARGGSASGFSLEDQVMFAEMQMAASYSGRAGLGMGSKSGGTGSGAWAAGSQHAMPQKRYTDTSWTDPAAAMPTPATLAAREKEFDSAAVVGSGVAAGGAAPEKEMRKEERKAAKKEARRAEKKAATTGIPEGTAVSGVCAGKEKKRKAGDGAEAGGDAAAKAAKKAKKEKKAAKAAGKAADGGEGAGRETKSKKRKQGGE